MKDYREMAKSVLSRRDAYVAERKKRMKKIVSIGSCFCLMLLLGIGIWHIQNITSNGSASGDLTPMVYVNDTLYRCTSSQPDLTGKEGQLVYLGAISSKVSSSQYPQEDFQANDDIVGSAVYQFGEDIVVEIDGQYWSYCAVLDVDYTTNDDGTYTCRGNTYKYMFEVSGVDGESQVTYIILSNNAETSFEEVAYSLRQAEMSTEAPAFVILGWYY